MRISGIYKIQSLIKPERCYIGSAVNIYIRWKSHLCYLRSGKHHCKKLQNHYNKNGKNDLVFSVIIGCDKNDLLSTEQFFLDSESPYFNTCKIAGNTLGIKATEETRKKLSIASRGNKGRRGVSLTEEHKQKIRESQMGDNNSFYNKHHTDEAKERIREWNKTHPLPKEIRERQRESLLKTNALKKLELINKN
jgi:group I intron endonuclease